MGTSVEGKFCSKAGGIDKDMVRTKRFRERHG